MTKNDITPTEPVLAAIDISKHRHEVLIEVSGKKRRRKMTVLNTLEDFNRLIKILSDYDRPVRVAFEATGNSHRGLAWRSDTPISFRTRSMHFRRREGLRSFPLPLPSRSTCPASGQTPRDAAAGSPSQAP